MKRGFLYAIAGVAVFGTMIALPLSVSANVAENESSFVEKLAQRLGLDQSQVEEALEQTQDELRKQMEDQRKSEIEEAVSSGKLTQRQGEILIGMIEVRPGMNGAGTIKLRDNFENLTENGRRANMDEKRAELDQEIVDSLNEKGLNTNIVELREAIEASKNAGLNNVKMLRGQGKGMIRGYMF